MAAQLYSGIKSLHLQLDTPYDLIRRDDIRDDLVGVKVWASQTPGFTPGPTNLVFDGLSLSITISNLTTNTVYYVKYAFISKIDPNTYTISNQLTQTVYDENVRVYGYLTNDPTGIATASDGTGGNFSLATGTFKVYNLSQDVTGTGPVYSIKPNSTFYIAGATINATTGVYSCTGMSADSGSVTFLATYNNIVIEQVWNVYKGIAGASAPLIQLSATNSDFVFKDQFAELPQTAQTTIKAALKNLTGTVVYTAKGYTRAGVLLGNIAFTQTDNSIVISGAQFGALGVTLGTVEVTATLGVVSDTFILYRINDGTEQITVELSNSAHVIPAANNGDTLPANYMGSGTTIRLKQGNTYLPVDSASPYDSLGTWNIFDITGNNITCDPTPTIGSDYVTFDTHAAMTADTAYIDYVINYRTTTGQVGTQTVRQSFAKSKEGVIGANSPAINIVAPRIAFVTPKNGGTTTPESITLTADTNNIVNPVYVWKIDNVIQTGQIANTLVVPKFNTVGAKTFKVEVSGTNNKNQSISLYDIITLYHINEGSDSLVVALDNESQTISCDSTGTPIVGQFPITRNTIVVRGVDPLTTGVAYAKVEESGMTSSISTTGVITITAITQLFASATYSFTVGTTTLNKTLTLNKSIDGASAPVVSLTAPTQVFITLKNAGGYAQNSIVVTSTPTNIPGATYKWFIDNVEQTGETGPTITISAFPSGTSKAIKSVVTGTGGKTAYDILSIFSLQEGSDSLAVGLSNENQTITANSDGIIYGGQLPITSQMTVVRGAAVLTTGVTYSKVSETGLSATISATGAISVNSYTAASIGSATFRATIGTVTIDKTLTVTKTKDGSPGARGNDGVGSTGAKGISTRVAYQLAPQSSSAAPAYTPITVGAGSLPTSGASIWTATAPTATIGNVVWYSYGRYNEDDYSQPEGIQVGRTVWSTPIAASVFQDIRSDNWNGGTPSGGNFNGASLGYYLNKTEGSLYGSAVYLRANSNVDIDGKLIVRGNNTGSQQVPGLTVNNTLLATITASYSYVNENNTYSATDSQGNAVGIIRAGVTGFAFNDNASISFTTGVVGYGNRTNNNAIGVIGSGKLAGGWFESRGTGGGCYAIWGVARGSNTRAAYFDGAVDISGPLGVVGTVTITGDITATGNVTAYNSSDATLKRNIVPIDNALQKLQDIGGYNYNWIPEYLQKHSGAVKAGLLTEEDSGVLAQEVLKHVPTAVIRRKDGTLAVNYNKLIPLLIQAIKELDRRTK